MINVVLMTGFLGAGKTTLMKEVLEAYKDYKTGVIVNEFGEINIDGMLLKKEGIQMAELSNGSIFCACIKDKFVDSLIEMSFIDLDYLFIEASGLADPANMTTILAGIQHKIKNKYFYKGSICVVDGETFLDMFELLPAIHSQLEFAGGVIVNKGDLIDEVQLKETLEKIKEVNPNVPSYITSFCKVDVKQIIDHFGQREDFLPEGRETSNTQASRPATFIVKGTEILPYEELREFILQVVSGSYRIKGFAMTDKGNIQVSTVGKNVCLEPWDGEIDRSEIVIISAVGFKMMSMIVKALDKDLKGKLSI
ncbi:MAG: GTP-binding protein [Anaerovoracaceae bacterium]